jgi:hypothetical protein
MSSAPIAFFAYDRSAHMRRAVEALLANELAASSDLYIFSDGPKSPLQEPAVADVRRYAGSVSGFRSVTVVERAGNLGLANSIIDGTTRLIREYGRVIALEDDLVDLYERYGVPVPGRQVRVTAAGGRSLRFDLAEAEGMVDFEADGARYHAGHLDRLSDAARDEAARAAGWWPRRFTAEQIRQRPLEVLAITRAARLRSLREPS